MSGSLLVGLDIGGTKTLALVVDRQFRQLSQVTRPTVTTSPAELVSAISETVYQALDEIPADPGDLAGIGIAVPGLVDPQRGLVKLAVNLNLESYPLGEALSAELGAPSILENDVRTATLGAYEYVRRSEPLRHLAYLSIGTGISAGVILDGELYRGAHGMAGEIGHVIVEPGGYRCGCGTKGCLEAVAAGPAIARLAKDILDADLVEKPMTAEFVYRAASQGNEQAGVIVRRVSQYLSRAIQLLIMSYDVEKVVLGGGVSNAGAAFLDPILSELSILRAQSSLAEAMLPDHKVSLLPAGYNPGAWGAITLVINSSDSNL